MNIVRIFIYYWLWHYSRAILDIFSIWNNFFHFIFNYFSIPLLLRTLFYPWKKIHEEYGGSINVSRFFGTVFINLVMRLVGFIIRSATIIVGLICIVIAFFVGLLALAIWLLLPFFIISLIYAGIESAAL